MYTVTIFTTLIGAFALGLGQHVRWSDSAALYSDSTRSAAWDCLKTAVMGGGGVTTDNVIGPVNYYGNNNIVFDQQLARGAKGFTRPGNSSTEYTVHRLLKFVIFFWVIMLTWYR